MDLEGSQVDVEPPNIAQKTISPRVFIEPTEKFTFRSFPDDKSKGALNWATEKELEVSAKEKKARRKEKQKEMKITSSKGSQEATAAVEPKTPTDPTIPPVIEKISRPETRKRKSQAVVEAANKRKVPAKAAAVGPPKVSPAPPRRQEMTSEEKSAQNKKKRDAAKSRKRA